MTENLILPTNSLAYSFHFFKNIYRMVTHVTNRIRCDFGHPFGVILPTV